MPNISPQDAKILDSILRREIDKSTLETPLESFPTTFLQGLTPLQSEILYAQERFIAVLAGRRAGKTHLLTAALLESASRPNTHNLFIGLTKTSAKGLIWYSLLDFNRNFSLNGIPNHTELTIRFPNNSYIAITGCKDESEIEKLRGTKNNLICLDEAGAFGLYLKYLVDVLKPTLFDYQGKMIIVGTPNYTSTGYFYEITAKNLKPWRTWHFTVLQNPKLPLWADKEDYLPYAKIYLEAEREAEGLTEESSSYQREYLAKWVRDDESLVIPSDISTYDKLYEADWNYIIGIDPGHIDDFAVVVGAYNRLDPAFYLEYAWAKSNLLTTEITETLLNLYDIYNPIAMPTDPGAGKQIIEDMAQQYNLPMFSAEKRDKYMFISMLTTDFKQNKIKIKSSLTKTIEDFKNLVWKDKKHGEMTGAPDHEFHALLYAWRESQHHHSKPNKKQTRGIDETTKLYWEKVKARIRSEQQDY